MRIREMAISVPAPFCKIVMTEAALPIGSRSKRVMAEDIDDVISLSLKKVKLSGYVLMHSTPVSFSVGGVVSLYASNGRENRGARARSFPTCMCRKRFWARWNRR